jgi:hypothetical protein
VVVGMTNFAQERNKMERRQHGWKWKKIHSTNELMLKKMTLNWTYRPNNKPNEKYHCRRKLLS